MKLVEQCCSHNQLEQKIINASFYDLRLSSVHRFGDPMPSDTIIYLSMFNVCHVKISVNSVTNLCYVHSHVSSKDVEMNCTVFLLNMYVQASFHIHVLRLSSLRMIYF